VAKRIVITGGTDTAGRHAVPHLRTSAHAILDLDRTRRMGPDASPLPKRKIRSLPGFKQAHPWRIQVEI
jgi:nucleoside-diphosphate-sugar epimerase